MALQSTGAISIGNVVTEKGTTPIAGGSYSLQSLATSGVNQDSASKPDGIAPHSLNEFYSYDHSAGGGGGGEFLTFFETIYDTTYDTTAPTDAPTQAPTFFDTLGSTTVETFTVLTGGATFVFNTEVPTTIQTSVDTEITTTVQTVVGQTTTSTSHTTSRLTS
jgi:hypothetical protein